MKRLSIAGTVHGRLAAALLVSTLLGTKLGGQTPPTARPPVEQAPVVKVTTKLVQVSVIIHNKKGDPVKNLTREDFRLYEEGREQVIRFFSVQSPEAKPNREPDLPANVFSNQQQRKSGRLPSASAILIDGLNTTPGDLFRVRHHLILFIRQLTPDDRLAIYTLGRELRVMHDFSSNTASLLRAVSQAGIEAGPGGAPLAVGGEDALPATRIDFGRAFSQLNHANYAFDQFDARRKADHTIAALATVAQRLSGLPGRKNLVWVSGGFPVSPLPCDT